MTVEKFALTKTQLGLDQIYEGFLCRVKTEMVKQPLCELAREDLVFTALLGPSFTLKKVLHDEPWAQPQHYRKQRNPHTCHPREHVSVQVLLAS